MELIEGGEWIEHNNPLEYKLKVTTVEKRFGDIQNSMPTNIIAKHTC